jgi:hypothetical protein
VLFVRRPRILLSLAAVALTAVTAGLAVPAARADNLSASATVITGRSPDGLGTWTVHYQHVEGGDAAVAASINDHLDNEANRLVQQATWDGSTRRPWTYDANGTLYFSPAAVSEIFTSEYDTDEPNMPMRSVSSVVCDSRSGVPITWDNLFVDKTSGLARLGDGVAEAVAAVAPPEHVRDWKRQGQFAPVEVNFKAWRPTTTGIEIHFPEFQFGRGLKAVTVPWAKLADQIRVEFAAIMG